MMISHSSRSNDRFATTRWSVVMHTAATPSEDGRSALTELVQRYWYPVYAYVRRCGHTPAIARDITGSFLKHLMHAFHADQAGAPRGDFRRYLLSRLHAFLGSDWKESIADDPAAELTAPADLEQRFERDSASAASPEEAYQRGFALEVISRAFKRLRSEANRAGHLIMYEALQPHLSQDPGPGEYEAIAQRLNSRPLALVVALKRLRQRFRELVGEELADTVTSAEELATEQDALHAVLVGMR